MGGNIHSMKLGNHIESSHRLLRDDVATEDRNYSFLYQLTHITRDRGSLTHDDRVDAVAGAVAHFQRAMMMDVDQAAKAMRDEEMLEEIEDFLEGFNQPTYRGMRVNGSGSLRGPQGGAKKGEVAKILRASVRPGRTPRVSSGQPGLE